MKHLLFSLLLCILFTSCSQGDPRSKNLVPVSGTVLFNGNPLGEVVLVFHHEDTTKQGGGAISAADGTFTLTTYAKNDGTAPGHYTITAVKEETTYPFTDAELLQLEKDGKDIPPGKTVSILPEKYRSKTTSGITIEVPPKGLKGFNIELTK